MNKKDLTTRVEDGEEKCLSCEILLENQSCLNLTHETFLLDKIKNTSWWSCDPFSQHAVHRGNKLFPLSVQEGKNLRFTSFQWPQGIGKWYIMLFMQKTHIWYILAPLAMGKRYVLRDKSLLGRFGRTRWCELRGFNCRGCSRAFCPAVYLLNCPLAKWWSGSRHDLRVVNE